MAPDLDAVRVGYPTMVPMVGTLGLEFLELEQRRVVMRLPDDLAYRNHVGGPHAGAMFTLAESVSGVLVLVNFSDVLDAVTPLPMEATIRFVKVALGPVTASATFDVDVAGAIATLDRGERPEFTIDVELSTGEGEERLVTGALSVRWTLRPNRR
jgi:acyl-coenzyme A thioesterase PaaI-like protein